MPNAYYWFRKYKLDASTFQAWLQDCRCILNNAMNGTSANRVHLCGPDGFGEPVLNDDLVAFNGDAASSLHAEAFEIPRIRKPQFQDEYDFKAHVLQRCSVSGKPYGTIVGDCLAAFANRFGPSVRVELDYPGLTFKRFRWLAPVIQATDDNMEKLAEAAGFTLIMCDIARATYRNHHRLRTAVRRIAKEHFGRLTVVLLDYDMCPETGSMFDAGRIPVFFMYRDGKRIGGTESYDHRVLERWVTNFLL